MSFSLIKAITRVSRAKAFSLKNAQKLFTRFPVKSFNPTKFTFTNKLYVQNVPLKTLAQKILKSADLTLLWKAQRINLTPRHLAVAKTFAEQVKRSTSYQLTVKSNAKALLPPLTKLPKIVSKNSKIGKAVLYISSKKKIPLIITGGLISTGLVAYYVNKYIEDNTGAFLVDKNHHDKLIYTKIKNFYCPKLHMSADIAHPFDLFIKDFLAHVPICEGYNSTDPCNFWVRTDSKSKLHLLDVDINSILSEDQDLVCQVATINEAFTHFAKTFGSTLASVLGINFSAFIPLVVSLLSPLLTIPLTTFLTAPLRIVVVFLSAVLLYFLTRSYFL
jgi:hypothetical protein